MSQPTRGASGRVIRRMQESSSPNGAEIALDGFTPYFDVSDFSPFNILTDNSVTRDSRSSEASVPWATKFERNIYLPRPNRMWALLKLTGTNRVEVGHYESFQDLLACSQSNIVLAHHNTIVGKMRTRLLKGLCLKSSIHTISIRKLSCGARQTTRGKQVVTVDILQYARCLLLGMYSSPTRKASDSFELGAMPIIKGRDFFYNKHNVRLRASDRRGAVNEYIGLERGDIILVEISRATRVLDEVIVQIKETVEGSDYLRCRVITSWEVRHPNEPVVNDDNIAVGPFQADRGLVQNARASCTGSVFLQSTVVLSVGFWERE